MVCEDMLLAEHVRRYRLPGTFLALVFLEFWTSGKYNMLSKEAYFVSWKWTREK